MNNEKKSLGQGNTPIKNTDDIQNNQKTENKNTCTMCGKVLSDEFHKIVNSAKQLLGLCDNCYNTVKKKEELQSKDIN